MNKTPMELFEAGGPIMWPIIFLSFVAVTVVVERILFALFESRRRDSKSVEEMLQQVEAGQIDEAIVRGKRSKDFVARVIVTALENRHGSMSDAFGKASSEELARFSRGLPVLDTSITAAPLLGLLGTVTGMMGTFGAIGGDLGAPVAVTGGIAEALIATGAGLFIAVSSLLPYNYLNSKVENARREIEEAGMALEMALNRGGIVDLKPSEKPALASASASPAHAH